jgi:hypothetical protein
MEVVFQWAVVAGNCMRSSGEVKLDVAEVNRRIAKGIWLR